MIHSCIQFQCVPHWLQGDDGRAKHYRGYVETAQSLGMRPGQIVLVHHSLKERKKKHAIS